ncbi:hypothetical protein [Paenibacillus sp. SN-8-1]|uniref:hypothetical protein n=1 Tax=Paenibacillus sp. SN-8-1 TaxID=3435409 RepID=UPI003D9A9FBF
MIGWINLVSLAFGLIARILPIINLIRLKELDTRNWIVYFMISTSSCAISLLTQIYHYYFLVRNGDFTGLIDTNGVVVFAASVLFIVTVILNGVTLTLYRQRTKKLAKV